MTDIAPPIPCVFADGAFRPLANFARVAAHHYGDGEVVALVQHQERSDKTHRHYFAMVKEVWENLPEDVAERFPTSEHLRKWALVKAGFYDEQTVSCGTRAEALRWTQIAAKLAEYAVVIPRGTIVSIYTAKSQSFRAMDKVAFAESKEKVLQVLSDLISVTPAQLQERARQVA